MSRTVLVVLTLALVLAVAGCGGYHKTSPGNGNADGPAVRDGDLPAVAGSSGGKASAGGGTSRETPGIIVRTGNRVSSQEADAVLEALDRQLTSLMDTLERMDDVEDAEVQY
ncbi:MAG: hypothetical protein K6T29_04545 [Peptococcaceae bacterium]|nr:hypothetical protein [Peptococcaceae bacterium]